MKRQIAIYGKGGIGKSTVAANLSAALASLGERVLQIGCDPKHDSTRLLLGGERITTVLDYMLVTPAPDYRLEDILKTGYLGVGCVEAGGPKPGVGCAGRGILSAFSILEGFHVRDFYDKVVYDVLGDVVCGGFAVPIRREYADIIFLVTSGEYMSLYAANNILRGVANYDQGSRRLGGIILNRRGLEDEESRVAAFASSCGLPVVADIPRDDTFALAEKENMTVAELASSPGLLAVFTSLARLSCDPDCALFEARPLEDEELEETILGTRRTASAVRHHAPSAAAPEPNTARPPDNAAYMSKNVLRDEPLHGCAFNGALTVCSQLTDAVTVAHAPKSCAYISYQSISSAGRRGLFERGSSLPASIIPSVTFTGMGEAEAVFGGTDKLLEQIARVKEDRSPAAVIAVSSCPSGIIGDDVLSAASLSDGRVKVVPVACDGNLTGDYLQGMIDAYLTLARSFIDTGRPALDNTINLVGEKVVAKSTLPSFEELSGWTSKLGLSVNCRFLASTTVEALSSFTASPLSVLAYDDFTGKLLKGFFEREYGVRFTDNPLPVGRPQSEEFITELGEFFGREESARLLIEENASGYDARASRLRSRMEGRRLMIITYNHDVDWIVSAARDAGMEVPMIGILDFSQDEGFRTRLDLAGTEVLTGYDTGRRLDDIIRVRPDVILANYSSSLIEGSRRGIVCDTIPMCPQIGFMTGLALVERWEKLSRSRSTGTWREDERLFARHYT